jgi:hypothetical protein
MRRWRIEIIAVHSLVLWLFLSLLFAYYNGIPLCKSWPCWQENRRKDLAAKHGNNKSVRR